MRLSSLVIACGLLAASVAGAAEDTGVLRWRSGDLDVLARPDARFTAAERVKQAATGGLNWLVICNSVRSRAVAVPDAADTLQKLGSKTLTPMPGLRWHAPAPLTEDIISLGVDPYLPLPQPRAQRVIDWTNSVGGAAILVNPDQKLAGYTGLLTGFAAFEAHHNGKWSPECMQGGAWDKLLAKGHRLIIVGGTSEATRPVLGRGAVATYVLAKSNGERAIVEAIRAGRTVVSDLDNIRLNFTVDGEPPGSIVQPKEGKVEVVIDLRAREPVNEIKIIGNVRAYKETVAEGEKVAVRRLVEEIVVLRRIKPDAKQVVRSFDLTLDPTTRYLRAVALIFRGACRTMTSPVFIGRQAPKPLPPNHRDQQVRRAGAAVEGLDWTDERRARDILAKLLAHRDIGPPAALYIAQNSDAAGIARIRPLLQSSEPTARALVAYAMLHVQGKAALPAITPMIEDTGSVPRIYAARMLARFAGPRHLGLAMRAERDKCHQVRMYGIAALGRIPSPEALFQLRRLLHQRQGPVRDAARAQVIRMLGVEWKRQKQFIEAFRIGKLGSDLLKAAVPREEVRPLAAVVAARELGEDIVIATGDDTTGPKQKFRHLTALQTWLPPRIDGRADDAVWQKAKAVGEFVLRNRQIAKQRTTVQAVYGRSALYLLFQCTEPKPGDIVADVKERDGLVWKDDSVEIYICPIADRTKPKLPYFRFCANTQGVQYDEGWRQARWNATWRAAATVGKTGWTLEVALPYASCHARPPGPRRTRWLVNFVRHRHVPPEEESSFASGKRTAPSEYAELRFE